MVAWVADVLGKPGFSKLVKFFRVKSIENSVEEAGEVFHPLKKQKKTIFFSCLSSSSKGSHFRSGFIRHSRVRSTKKAFFGWFQSTFFILRPNVWS